MRTTLGGIISRPIYLNDDERRIKKTNIIVQNEKEREKAKRKRRMRNKQARKSRRRKTR